jgi:hypothetical protein
LNALFFKNQAKVSGLKDSLTNLEFVGERSVTFTRWIDPKPDRDGDDQNADRVPEIEN